MLRVASMVDADSDSLVASMRTHGNGLYDVGM